jgi:hypothetical protein
VNLGRRGRWCRVQRRTDGGIQIFLNYALFMQEYVPPCLHINLLFGPLVEQMVLSCTLSEGVIRHRPSEQTD